MVAHQVSLEMRWAAGWLVARANDMW